MQSKSNLLSIEQTAEILGVSSRTVRRLIASRRLKAINLAEPGKQNCIRIKPESIDALIADSELPESRRRIKLDKGNLRPSKFANIRSFS